jgi:hypothetical protein
MPDATITSTASTFGTISGVFSADQSTISGTISGIVPGTLTGSVGVPGPQGPTGATGATGATGPTGPAGSPGVGVPAGGTAGQFLTKIDGTNYNTDWTTVNLSAYAVKANNLSDLTNFATARDNLGLGTLNSPTFAGITAQGSGANVANLTPTSLSLTHATSGSFTIQPSSGITFPDATVQTTAFTTSQLTAYLAKASNLSDLPSASTARTNLGLGSLAVVNDAPSDGSQYARKNAAWDVVISGDRYLTTSTTSNTVSNGNKTFTIGTGLSYTPTQNITISYDASNHMHGEVLTYNSGTGVLTVDINHHTGSGTYTAWVVNVGGVTPATSVAWGAITGTLSSQTDLQNALDLKLAATTAASTYATILEPSVDGILTVEPSGSNTATLQVNQDANNYIHLRAGAGQIAMIVGGATKWFFNDTYLQFPGGTQQTVAYPGSSGFLLKADNLSGLANTGTARTNLGLGTMAVETATNYLTTATASSTYFTIANAANKADLASPTFTGTPTLPTGTIATTQSPGNNTTALATTAFVTAAVPAASTTVAGLLELATRLEVVEPSSSTLAVSPMRALDVLMNPGYVQIAQNTNNVAVTTSGTGASSFTTSMTRVCIGPNVSVAGFAYYRPQTNGGVGQFFAKGINNASINFSKPFWMSGRSLYDDTFRGDANNTSRITVGKSATGAGALAQKGIGWQKVGGLATNFFLLAHNGTTLTSVDTNTSLNSLGITGGVPFDWSVYSDGAGNVTMFINNVQVATTSAGPTGYSTGSSVWQEEIDQTASAATRMYFATFGGHYYHA